MSETPERPAISRAEYNRRLAAKRKRQRRKRIRTGIIALLVLAVLIIGIVLICKSCSADKSIVGTWDYDTVTVYRFDKDGKGAFVVGTHEGDDKCFDVTVYGIRGAGGEGSTFELKLVGSGCDTTWTYEWKKMGSN